MIFRGPLHKNSTTQRSPRRHIPLPPAETPSLRVVIVPGGIANQLRGHPIGPLARHLALTNELKNGCKEKRCTLAGIRKGENYRHQQT